MTRELTTMQKKKVAALFLFLVIMIFAIVVLRNAWVSDDAYITFRTVNNFVNGYGLTWNVGERVQAYTHPLWMFMVSALYFFTHEAYYTSIFLSLLLSLAAVLIFALKIANSRTIAILGILVLTGSKAFIDYSTSGLENPLNHLILALFFLVYFQGEPNQKKLFLLSLIASLGMLNRIDTVLIYFPCLLYAMLRFRKKSGLYWAAIGFTPIVVWELFSLFYYGFPFPNTAYAKLHTGISDAALAVQGIRYFKNSFDQDPLTLVTIIASLVAALLKRERDRLAVAGGMALYLLYIIKIGGDFMSGRFFTVVLFSGVMLLSQYHNLGIFGKKQAWMTGLIIITVSLTGPFPPILSNADYGLQRQAIYAYGIADERAFYYQASGLLKARKGQIMPNHVWTTAGLEARKKGPSVVVRKAIGYYGYFAGPAVYIVDEMALSDPLLARLPAKKPWRIGHFERNIPSGYLATLRSGKNQIKDRGLAEYYDKLSLVTRGNLFDKRRLLEIWNFNTGKNEYLIKNNQLSTLR